MRETILLNLSKSLQTTESLVGKFPIESRLEFYWYIFAGMVENNELKFDEAGIKTFFTILQSVLDFPESKQEQFMNYFINHSTSMILDAKTT